MTKARILTLSRVMPGKKLYSSVNNRASRQAHGNDMELLQRCRSAWNSLSGVRETRARTMRYCMGDQWGDTIKVWDHGSYVYMTEREYMERKNTTPMSNNVMASILESIGGLYAKQGTEPVCFARDNDSRAINDMMSATLQCNWQSTYMQDLLNHAIKDYVIGGQMYAREGWESKQLDLPDAWTELMEPDFMFFECGSDPRHEDISLIGCLHDVSREDLYQKFARPEFGLTIDDLDSIFSIQDVSDDGVGYEFNEEKNLCNVSFDHTNKSNHYVRVIEVWTTETKMRLQCFDPIATNANNSYFKVDMDDTAMIEKLRSDNIKRKKMYDDRGVPEDERAYIVSEKVADKYWYYTYMAPDGTVLCKGETPYDYKSHPFTIKLFPYLNGKIHPFLANVIDQQRYINRLIVMNDMAIRSSSKYEDSGKALSKMLDSNKWLAAMVLDSTRKNMHPFEWMASQGIDIKAALEDEELGKKVAAQISKFQEKVAEQEKHSQQLDDNLRKSYETLQGLGLSDEETNELWGKVFGVIQDAEEGNISAETWKLFKNAYNYDADISSAREEAAMQARNEKIQNKVRSSKTEGGMPPSLANAGSGNEPAKTTKRESFFDGIRSN